MLGRKRWRLAGVCAVSGLINAVLVITQLVPHGATPQNDGRTLKLVAINVQTSNKDSNRVLRFLNEADPARSLPGVSFPPREAQVAGTRCRRRSSAGCGGLGIAARKPG